MIFKPGDAVICTTNHAYGGSDFKHEITIGKAYIVVDVDEAEDMIKILNDKNIKIWYMTNRFNFLNEST